jgi:hypothetical protein
VITALGHSKVFWEADISGVDNARSPPFYFKGWPFQLVLQRDEGLRWGVFLGSLGLPHPAPEGWTLRRVQARYTLAFPGLWFKDYDVENMNLLEANYGTRGAILPVTGSARLKVQVIMKRLVAELEPAVKDTK